MNSFTAVQQVWHYVHFCVTLQIIAWLLLKFDDSVEEDKSNDIFNECGGDDDDDDDDNGVDYIF